MNDDFDEDVIYGGMYIHLAWSTKNQQRLLSSIDQYLYEYMCDLVLPHQCDVIYGRVFSDHVQLVVNFSPDISLYNLLTNLKVATALLIRTNFPELKDFEWQKSDFGFTVSVDEVGALIERIKKAKLFKEEVFSLLDQNEMKYDSVEVLE